MNWLRFRNGFLIADPPGKPGRPELTNWDKDFVDLEWTAPKSDGGAPIEKYIVQMRDKEGRTWENVMTVPGDRTYGKVTAVEEGHEYDFRVVPVNKAGNGEPSDPSKSVVAKPRFCKSFVAELTTNLAMETVAVIIEILQFQWLPTSIARTCRRRRSAPDSCSRSKLQSRANHLQW